MVSQLILQGCSHLLWHLYWTNSELLLGYQIMDLVCSWHRSFPDSNLVICCVQFACPPLPAWVSSMCSSFPKWTWISNEIQTPTPWYLNPWTKPAVPTQSEFQMKFTLAYLEVLLAEHMHTRWLLLYIWQKLVHQHSHSMVCIPCCQLFVYTVIAGRAAALT